MEKPFLAMIRERNVTDKGSVRCSMRRTWPIAGFGNRGQGVQDKECRWPLKSGKGKETNSSLEPPERNRVLANTLILAQF